jgi:hypothetical protein
VAATGLAEPAAPAGGAGDHRENPLAAPAAGGPDDFTRVPADNGSGHHAAGRSSAAIPVRAPMPETAGQPHADRAPDQGAGGNAGRSWLPSCVVPASAGLTAGHDHSCGDAVQSSPAERPEPSHRRNDGVRRAVTSVKIQPGVTPD